MYLFNEPEVNVFKAATAMGMPANWHEPDAEWTVEFGGLVFDNAGTDLEYRVTLRYGGIEVGSVNLASLFAAAGAALEAGVVDGMAPKGGAR